MKPDLNKPYIFRRSNKARLYILLFILMTAGFINTFLPGSSKIYRLNEIKAAVIHAEGYGERLGIRIVRTDYTSSFFIASSFRRQKWKSLQEALKKEESLSLINSRANNSFPFTDKFPSFTDQSILLT